MKRTIALAATTVALLAPAQASADEITIGSDLSAPATVARSDPNDVVWWPATVPAGTIESPVAGQAIIMRLKGGTQQPQGRSAYPDYDLMHFVVLRPQPDGTWRTTATSVDLRMPVIGAGADENTVSTYTSVWPLCVQPGDRIGLASVGGFDPVLFPRGLPYQVFAPAQGAVLHEFLAGGTIDQGRTVIRASRVAATELLLQVVIGTGPSARPTCGGTAPGGSDPGTAPRPQPAPAAPAAPARAKVVRPQRPPWLYDGKVKLWLRCSAAADCEGELTLRARGRRIGLREYALDAGERAAVVVRLTRRGARMVRRAGRLRVRAQVTAGDTRTTRRFAVRG